jgi:hypothetical protein
MIHMAKNTPKKPNRSEAWTINTRVDPALKPVFDLYVDSEKREFKPTMAQVLEKALKMLFREDGLWPPKQDTSKNDEED